MELTNLIYLEDCNLKKKYLLILYQLYAILTKNHLYKRLGML